MEEMRYDQRFCLWGSPHDVTIVDALTEVFVGWVVRKASELILDCLGQVGIFHYRILGFLVCKVGIKVGNVEDGFLVTTRVRSSVEASLGYAYHAWFERRLYLFL